MSKPVSHFLDIYSAWLHLAPDEKAWRKLRRELTSLAEDPGGLAYTSLDIFETDAGAQIRHLSVFVNVAAHAGREVALVETVAHEADHVASLLFGEYDIEIRARDEPHAYLVGWVAQWLWKNLPGRG